MSNRRFWFVRAGEGAAYADEFLSQEIVAVGWKAAGKLTADNPDSDFDNRFQAAYPEESDGTRKSWAAQVKRFIREIAIGDPVATYDAERRTYLLGAVAGDAQWREAQIPRFRKDAETRSLVPLQRIYRPAR